VAAFETRDRDYFRVRIPAAGRSEAVEIACRLTDKGLPAVIFEGE
jgi:hypothetical protein